MQESMKCIHFSFICNARSQVDGFRQITNVLMYTVI